MKKVILLLALFTYCCSFSQEILDFSILSEKAKKLSDEGKYQSSNEVLYTLLKEKLSDEDEFDLISQILSNHYTNNRMDSSTIYLKTLKKLAKKHPSEKKNIEVIYREGLFFLSENDKKRAITSFFESSKKAEKIGDYVGYIKNTTAIGRVLYINKDYSKALEYFIKSIKKSSERNLPSYEGNARALKGITEIALGNLESSINEFQIAENLLTSRIDLLMLEIMKMNYYLEKGDQVKVNSMALSILAEMNTMELSGTLGDVSKLTKRINSSTDKEILDHLDSIEKSIEVKFKQDGELEAYIKASTLIAKQDEKKSDEIRGLKKLIKIKDSTYSLEKEKIITELEVKYETEKKEKEVLKLSEETAKKELTIEKEKKKKCESRVKY